jgi:hypothetical protein
VIAGISNLASSTGTAELYGVETKILNRGVRRNPERFPEDFMFQLTKDETESLRIQFGTLEFIWPQLVFSARPTVRIV